MHGQILKCIPEQHKVTRKLSYDQVPTFVSNKVPLRGVTTG